jgi:ELWxxDGT repeat protein
MKTFTLCALLVLLALPAAGVEPYLVKDINPVPGQSGSDPSRAVTFDGAAFFFANDGVSGRQLWRSDGTAAGTFQVGDSGGGLAEPWPVAVTERLYFYVWPRTQPRLGSEGTLWVTDGTSAGTLRLTGAGWGVTASTSLWVASQGVLYFIGWDVEHGSELWRSDGTPAGTYLVADVRPGAEASAIEELTEYRGRVWFAADDGQHGRALWSSDGIADSEAGTVLAVDPIPSSARRGTLNHIRVVGDRITFFAFPPGRGNSRQLWGGDGTARGTYPITRLAGGKGKPVYLHDSVVSGNRLYFLAEDRQGRELWVSDGTARGTQPLTGFAKPDAFLSDYLDGLEINGRFVFLADDGRHGFEAWVTDGTPQGTRLLRDICPGDCHGFAGGDLYLVFGGRLLFAAAESYFSELWSTDGTPEGTRRISGVWPQTLLPAGDRLFFVAQDDHGWQVWRTDGTAAGTARVTDFEYGLLPSDESQGTVVDGLLLFGADDGEHGFELWRTDGTAAGTWLVEDLNQADVGGSFPTDLRPLGDEVVFNVRNDRAQVLWKSDGTAAGTVPFRTLAADERESPGQLRAHAQAGGRLFYLAHDYELWRTDGTEAGTFRLTGEAGAICCEMEAVGSTVFFKLWDEEHGHELWASDGTAAGTRLVLDIDPGAAGGFPEELTAFQGRLFFSAQGPGIGGIGGIGIELWQSDGTAAGTVPVKDVNPGAGGSRPRLLTVHAGRLWFFAEDGEHGLDLWSSDGTEAGTRLEVGFLPDGSSYLPDFMVSLGDRLVFSFSGNGLWASDGTPAGTRRIARKADSVDLRTVFRGRLYYPAEHALWSTDGTEAGTGALLDRDGNLIYGLYAFAALGDRLLFTAQNAVGQTALWQSDGTPAGTFQIHPTSGIGNVSGLVRAGDRVFFSSFDPATGTELWAVRP